jgi:hypothetical protein
MINYHIYAYGTHNGFHLCFDWIKVLFLYSSYIFFILDSFPLTIDLCLTLNVKLGGAKKEKLINDVRALSVEDTKC